MAQNYLLKLLFIHLTLLAATNCRIIVKRDIAATSTIPPDDELQTELPTTASQLIVDSSKSANYANYSNYDHLKSKADAATPSTVAQVASTIVTETKKSQMADEQSQPSPFSRQNRTNLQNIQNTSISSNSLAGIPSLSSSEVKIIDRLIHAGSAEESKESKEFSSEFKIVEATEISSSTTHKNEIRRADEGISEEENSSTQEAKNIDSKVQMDLEDTNDEESTTILSTLNKKPKFLNFDDVDPSNNINTTIPNAAEVWALVGMRNHDYRNNRNSENATQSPIEGSNSSNSTLKVMTDWMIMKAMNEHNESMTSVSEELEQHADTPIPVNRTLADVTGKVVLENDLIGENNDPASSENKITSPLATFISSTTVLILTTPKTVSEDNRIDFDHVDHETIANKTSTDNITKISTSRMDVEILDDNDNDERENLEVVNVRLNQSKNGHIESIRTNPTIQTTTVSYDEPTTEPYSGDFTTEPSAIDAFTVIGEDFDGEDYDAIFKRTVLPDNQSELSTTADTLLTTTDRYTQSLSSQATSTSPSLKEETEIASTLNPSINEIPQSTEAVKNFSQSSENPLKTTLKYTTKASSKTISSSVNPLSVSTTEEVSVSLLGLSSTINPSYIEFKPMVTTVKPHLSSTGPFDDDKFKYSTVIDIDLLPQASSTQMTTFSAITTESPRVAKTTNASLPDEPPTVKIEPKKTGKAAQETTTEINLDESTGTASANQETPLSDDSNINSIIAISVSCVAVIIIFSVLGFLFFMRKRQKQLTYGQRCRPVGLDAYSLDNVSVFNSVRRKANALRLSKRSYGNSAFEDPSLQSNVLDYKSLQDFSKNKTSIHDEFKEIPQISVRVDEVPEGCEDKNRYANVVPYPETRVHLKRLDDDEKTEYINANFVKGPKDTANYYIATQAPLENTVPDFWRMIWEQNSKVIIMATDLYENSVEKCAEYIPPSVVLDNARTFGDFQVTLKSREVKDKYAVSFLHLKNLKTTTWREIVHFWYQWPEENGVPTDETSVITMLLEARNHLRSSLAEQLDENSNENTESLDVKKLSTLDKTKSLQRTQGPLTVHCSPGTGRTGTLIACDIILRYLETPPRQIDIPQIVYNVRRGRASSVRAKDQYEFIYKVANSYGLKLSTPAGEN